MLIIGPRFPHIIVAGPASVSRPIGTVNQIHMIVQSVNMCCRLVYRLPMISCSRTAVETVALHAYRISTPDRTTRKYGVVCHPSFIKYGVAVT